MLKKYGISIVSLLLLSMVDSQAEIPVVDLSQGSTQNSSQNDNDNGNVVVYSSPSTPTPPNYSSNTDRRSLPLEERVQLLEQQANNTAQLNLSAKMDGLLQKIQELNGQLEVQAHTIQTLSEQQKSFYQDLDQRLTSSNTTRSYSSQKKTLNNSAPAPQPSVETESDNPIANAESAIIKSASAKQKAPGAASTNSKPAISEEKAYQNAFNLLVNKQTSSAIIAFKKFLKTYPKGAHTANAHYWLGELYNTVGKNELASAEFNTVINEYPGNAKIADAMLKIAIIQDADGQHEIAQRGFKQVLKQFSDSAAARLAKMHLEQMKATATH